ncbi:MAG TPA: hypothetical protein VG963_17725, partial [Polyangiaceae bacterium]|nr:hypothetical protein [Polyangiaceae bacterium]
RAPGEALDDHPLKNTWTHVLEGGVAGVKQRVEEVKQRVGAVAQRLVDESAPPRSGAASQTSLRETQSKAPLAEAEDLPVVARLVVEIRSDGSRTLARGALEDALTGETVSVEAKGGSPAQLAASLATNLLTTPLALGRAAGALMRGRLRRPGS